MTAAARSALHSWEDRSAHRAHTRRWRPGLRTTRNTWCRLYAPTSPHHAELQFRGVGHHAAIPHRIEHHFDVRVLGVGQRLDLGLDAGLEPRTHAAAGRGQRHLYFHVVAAAV